MKGYKVFNPGWTCRGVQYEVGKTYEMEGKPVACERGFHFCKELADCFKYYQFDTDNKVAEIEATGELDFDDNKCCTNEIKIIRELEWHEVLDIVNMGRNCTGRGNTGNCNTGHENVGDRNAGDYNTGDRNTGDNNTGDWNAGDRNAGNCNTGDNNTGDCNTGDWNRSNHNSGCFNTKKLNISMFNKASDWSYNDWSNSRACMVMAMCPREMCEWAEAGNMTAPEKESHPSYKTTGGYLKKIEPTKEEKQAWWDSLTEGDRQEVKNLPNFDKDIFEKITGIRA